eukprot:3503549-Amphidinium_carterae.1
MKYWELRAEPPSLVYMVNGHEQAVHVQACDPSWPEDARIDNPERVSATLVVESRWIRQPCLEILFEARPLHARV